MKKYLIGFFLFLVSCSNVLEDVSKKDTDEAVFYEAKMEMNDHDYDTAIDLMETLSPEFLAKPEVAIVVASAYSGRCGLDFVSFSTSISDLAADGTFFQSLMEMYPDVDDDNIADCVEAEDQLKDFGDETARTDDQNLLMGFSSLTKVGVVLSRFADTDADGEVDASFDHCSTTSFPDAAVIEVATGIALAVTSITASAEELAGDTLTDISNFCGLAPQLAIFCTGTDREDYASLSAELLVLRSVLGSSEYGIGACTGDFTDPDCACL